jgi:hypothetical protein
MFSQSLSSKIDVHNTNICSHDITMTESRDNKRGLASADEETRERVAKAGGEAPHEERGLEAADEQTKKE